MHALLLRVSIVRDAQKLPRISPCSGYLDLGSWILALGSWIKIKSLELETGVYRGREMLFSGTVPPDMPPYFGRVIKLFVK